MIPNPEKLLSNNPETRQKPNIAQKLSLFAIRAVSETACRVIFGPEHLPASITGLCEDAILSPRLCSPNETSNHLIYQQAPAGQWISHDFRRSEFYPTAANEPWLAPHREGTLTAMMIENIEERDENVRTNLPISKWLTAENLMAIDTPRIEQLLELGMVARRSHELAYEIAEQEKWIGELRSRGVAQDIVYQVTPKAHSLIIISEEDAKKKPKAKQKPETFRLPSRIAY